jgi:hypothetical protein
MRSSSRCAEEAAGIGLRSEQLRDQAFDVADRLEPSHR